MERQTEPPKDSMTTKPTSGRASLLSVLALVLLTGCANAQSDPNEERWGVHRFKRIQWEEEVRFSTGEVIVKRGERRRAAYGGEMRPGWLFDEAWIEATLLGVGPTRWEGSLSPLVLDVTPAGEWYLLAAIGANRGRRDYQLSRDMWYVAFRLSGTTWQRIPFAEFPESFKPNLLADTTQLI